MKKGTEIQKILINGDHVSVYDTDGVEVKITRSQRAIFRNYHHWNFLEKLSDEFGRTNVMSKHYCVIKDGELVYSTDDNNCE
jgi:hypothetical protein